MTHEDRKQLRRKNQECLKRFANICGAMGPHAKKHRKRWSINEDIAQSILRRQG